MKRFFSDDVFLTNETAKSLYSAVKDMPIFDYHCHLSPEEIYSDRRYKNIGELWLECDHYKWRIMRHFGIDERFITGDAEYKEKFFKFCEALPRFAGNPVYHWCHLELKKYFGIDLPICAANAEYIWTTTENMMQTRRYSARELIVRSRVDTVVTTDDPLSDLSYHTLLREEERFSVLPCFRPDRVIAIEKEDFADYVRELSSLTDIEIDGIDSLVKALESRLLYFLERGCVAADISFENFPRKSLDRESADRALVSAVGRKRLNRKEMENYRYHIIAELSKLFARHDVATQIHFGVIRNQNTKLFREVGVDCGNDSVAGTMEVNNASALLDEVNVEVGLPKTILYTLNPTSYYPLATLIGDFAGRTRGRVQLGAAWWFLDHKDGIYEQMRILSATAGIGNFNGMLTDSRSFTSYARHDYFRRILCSLVGEWVERGEYHHMHALSLVKDVCYNNCKKYFVR